MNRKQLMEAALREFKAMDSEDQEQFFYFALQRMRDLDIMTLLEDAAGPDSDLELGE